jgi:sugar O-acyltransferase (sialic acid O-acetyltransferase NeuD family)
MSKPALIFGAGQVAEVFADYLQVAGRNVSAFVIDDGYESTIKTDKPIIPFSSVRESAPPENYCFVVGMSFKGLNKPRAEKFEAMLGLGYSAISHLDTRASFGRFGSLGGGLFILENNVIQSPFDIGNNCILWSGNHVGHHTKIGNHVFIASHAVIGGGCEIGDRSFIGVNATIRDNVKVGADCIIGAGALVLTDVPDGTVIQPKESERSRVPSSRVRW